MKASKLVIGFLAAAGLLIGPAAAQLAGAGTTPTGSNETASTGSASQETVQAGSVLEVDVSTTDLTDKWAGFYGNVTGDKELGDGGNTFYRWTGSNFAGAKVATVPSGDAAPSSIADPGDPNTFLGSEYDSGIDDATTTFSLTQDVTLDGSTASNAPAVKTFNQSGDGNYSTVLVENTAEGSAPAYIAKGQAAFEGFDGSAYNYQMLVGVGESSSERAFDFYLELP